jgi:protein gp37
VAEDTPIEWADHTFNPWEGCQETGSPACVPCYARERNKRFAPKGGPRVAPNWGPHAPRRRTAPANWRKPLKWAREAAAFFAEHGRRQRVFSASLADIFDNAVDPQWRRDLFDLIDATPELDWLLLTKRAGIVMKLLAEIGRTGLPANVWMGATVVTQEEADRDIPKLLAIPARVRFLSMEPLMEYVDILRYLQTLGLDWVIVGGMSGRTATPMHPRWAAALRDQCASTGTAFLFKQWGEWAPANDNAIATSFTAKDLRLVPFRAGDRNWHGAANMAYVGKKKAGRLLDGVAHDGFPVGVANVA